MQKIVIMRPGALGDVLLLRPALYMLKKESPELDLTVFAPGSKGRLLLQQGFADNVIDLEARESLWLFSEVLCPPKSIFSAINDADAAICFCKENLIIRNSFKKCGIDYVYFYKDRPSAKINSHTAQYLWASIAEALGLAAKKITYSEIPGLVSQSDLNIASILKQHNLHKGRYSVIHPGSGSPEKNADLNSFIDFANKYIHNQIVIISGEADGDLAEKLHKLIPQAKVLTMLSLTELAVILTNTSLYTGNDSGVSHLASQCGVPANVFFKTTDPKKWAPVGMCVNVIDLNDYLQNTNKRKTLDRKSGGL